MPASCGCTTGHALEGAGFDVDEALNGMEALEKLLIAPVDLLIVDVNMPQMDGLTFIKTLRRQSPAIASIPVLVTSTESGPQDVHAARVAGANFYLNKPVSQEQLGPACAHSERLRRLNQFIEQFLIEGRELVEQAVNDLLALETRPGAAAHLDGVFRAVHTLKGAAGIIDFAAMARGLHAARGRVVGGPRRRPAADAGPDQRLPVRTRSGGAMA